MFFQALKKIRWHIPSFLTSFQIPADSSVEMFCVIELENFFGAPGEAGRFQRV